MHKTIPIVSFKNRPPVTWGRTKISKLVKGVQLNKKHINNNILKYLEGFFYYIQNSKKNDIFCNIMTN